MEGQSSIRGQQSSNRAEGPVLSSLNHNTTVSQFIDRLAATATVANNENTSTGIQTSVTQNPKTEQQCVLRATVKLSSLNLMRKEDGSR